MATEIDRAEATARIAAGARVLDAQGPDKFEREHIIGAIRDRIDDPDSTIALLGNDLDREICRLLHRPIVSRLVAGSETARRTRVSQRVPLHGRAGRLARRRSPGRIDVRTPSTVHTEQAATVRLSVRDEAKPFILIAAIAVGLILNRAGGGALTMLKPVVQVGLFLVIFSIMAFVEIGDVGQAFRKRKPTTLAVATNSVI